MNKLFKARRFQITVISLLCSLTSIATAREQVPDRMGISLGYFMVRSINTTAGVVEKDSIFPIGTNIDLEKNLGIGNNDNSFRLDSFYRFNNRHQITLTYYQIKVSGNRTLTDEFTWDDQLYEVGAQVGSFFKNKTVKVGYLFSFHHDKSVELAFGGGLHITKFNIGLDLIATASGGTAPVGFETEAELNATAPVPYMSFLVNYAISPRWSFYMKNDTLRLSFNDINGLMTDSMVAVEHRTFKNVAFGLGLNYFRIELDGDKTSERYKIDSNFDGLLFYAKAVF